MISGEALFGLVMGLTVALFIEKYYIDRISILPNAAATLFLFLPYYASVPSFVKYWIYIGIILGVIAVYSRFGDKELPSVFYDFTYAAYSGKTIMGIYIAFILFKELLQAYLFTGWFWFVTLAIIFALWFVGVKYLENDAPFSDSF